MWYNLIHSGICPVGPTDKTELYESSNESAILLRDVLCIQNFYLVLISLVNYLLVYSGHPKSDIITCIMMEIGMQFILVLSGFVGNGVE